MVTGANKGIGLDIARELGTNGVTVIVGTRDAGRGQAAADLLRGENLDVHFVQLDVTDAASITLAALATQAQHGRLDILVNNAGINDSGDGAPSGASIDAARRLFETNFFGALAVTQAMLPLLRLAQGARIVNMSSSLGSMAVNSDPANRYYKARLIGCNASKAALNMLTVSWLKSYAARGLSSMPPVQAT